MRMTVGVLVFAAAAAACGSGATEPAATPPSASEPPSTSVTPAWAEPVSPREVEVVGGLDESEHELVDWALGRFERAGLLLPQRIEFEFDSTGRACRGCLGICHVDRTPPAVAICAPDGTTAHRQLVRRIALLHELAHVWHRSTGDGSSWPDVTEVVGGSVDVSVDWEHRMHERVAVAISWGLLDQLRRPVGSDLPCSTLFRQFTQLTGHPPLGPLEPVCHP